MVSGRFIIKIFIASAMRSCVSSLKLQLLSLKTLRLSNNGYISFVAFTLVWFRHVSVECDLIQESFGNHRNHQHELGLGFILEVLVVEQEVII